MEGDNFEEERWYVSSTYGVQLFQSYYANNEGYGIYRGYWQLKRIIFLIVRNNQHMIFVASRFDAFNERSLICVDDIYFIPLEKQVGHWYSLAGYNISGAVFGVHAGSLYRNEKVCALKHRNDITLTFIFKDSLFTCKGSGHSFYGDKWNAIARLCGGRSYRSFIGDSRLLFSGHCRFFIEHLSPTRH